MKLLLDGQIDVRMKAALAPHPVFTVQDMGWLGVKNGVLRERLNQHGFQYFVTADKNLPFQQNLAQIRFTLVLLDTPTLLWEHQRQFAPALLTLLAAPPVPLPTLIHVAVEELSRGRKRAALARLLPAERLLFL